MGCPACGAPRITRLSMTLTDGSPATFVCCSRCEYRQWLVDDQPVTTEHVIARSRRPVQ